MDDLVSEYGGSLIIFLLGIGAMTILSGLYEIIAALF